MFKVVSLFSGCGGADQGIIGDFVFNKKKYEFIQDYNKLSMEELLNKWFPMTFKVKAKKLVRRMLNGMGLDMVVKKLKRKIGG